MKIISLTLISIFLVIDTSLADERAPFRSKKKLYDSLYKKGVANVVEIPYSKAIIHREYHPKKGIVKHTLAENTEFSIRVPELDYSDGTEENKGSSYFAYLISDSIVCYGMEYVGFFRTGKVKSQKFSFCKIFPIRVQSLVTRNLSSKAKTDS